MGMVTVIFQVQCFAVTSSMSLAGYLCLFHVVQIPVRYDQRHMNGEKKLFEVIIKNYLSHLRG